MTATLAAFFAARSLCAQSYANISESRPLDTEDAVSIDRYALEAYLAPVALKRTNGSLAWSVTPGIAYGILPRTQIELDIPFESRKASPKNTSGLLGIDLSTLYAFNRESSSLPGLAVRGGVLVPVGGLGPQNAHESLKAIVTRTFRWGRLHFNHEHTWGEEPRLDSAARRSSAGRTSDLSRWRTSIAADKTLPMSGLLIAGEVFARREITDDASSYWSAAAGARYEVSPVVAVDLAFVTTLNADLQSWAVRFGVTKTFAVRSFAPGLGPWGR